jgi:pimeloyl-ACP methyl ester carboxylesterase
VRQPFTSSNVKVFNIFNQKSTKMAYPSHPRLKAASQRLPIGRFSCHLSCWGPADAPLVILLHGWGDTGTSFQFLAEEIGDACRLVAPDWRGFGRSTVADEAFWFPDYLADLDILLDTLSPHAPVRLVGHSMGANVAGLYAGVRPERVSHFVNLEGFGLPDSKPDDAPDRYMKWLDRRKANRPFRDYPDFAAFSDYLQTRFSGLDAARADFIARCWAQETDGRVTLRANSGHRLPNPILYRRAEAEACWRRITAEFLFITGAKSEFATPDIIESVLRHVPAGEHVRLQDAGHMLHFDAPAALAREITRFLRL